VIGVTLIRGDGIGPVVIEAARRVLEATGVPLEWDERTAGVEAVRASGDALPPELLDSIRSNRLALKGPVATPVGAGFRSVNVRLRQELDLYAGVRPCRRMPGVRSRYEDVDIVVIRENTEDMYTGIEFEEGERATKQLIAFIEDETGQSIREDAGVSIKTISEFGSRRIVRFAFEYAARRGRSTVTASHKANIMKCSDGLFLETARRVAGEEFPNVPFEDRIIDALCMQLAQAPERFDVLVMPNLYGDVVSDLCAGLIGGLGLAPSGNFGEGVAVFEPVHGTGPKIRPPERANPIGAILSGAMLLRHVGEGAAASRVEDAVGAVVAEGRTVTYDLRPSRDDPQAASAFEVADAIVDRLAP
jgi:isocitrate dehydrogenase (NAD+)